MGSGVAGGGGELPLYKSYRYVLPQRAAFLCRFGLEMGIDFTQFGLESGMKWVRKKDKYANLE